MKTWLYCLCGNEDAIIPYFMRWYAPEVDRLIMLDGGMTPQTMAAIHEYPSAEVQPSPFTPDNYDDAKFAAWIGVKYREARNRADWVIIVDADEFLWTGKSLRKSLEDYETLGTWAVRAFGYQMAADHFPTDEGQLPDLIRVGAYDRGYNKTCCFLPSLNVRFSVGRHNCAIGNYEPAYTGMKLLHYRYFGDEYMRERNARSHARRSADDLATGRGYHVAPDYDSGKYSAAWYREILAHGRNVVEA